VLAKITTLLENSHLITNGRGCQKKPFEKVFSPLGLLEEVGHLWRRSRESRSCSQTLVLGTAGTGTVLQGGRQWQNALSSSFATANAMWSHPLSVTSCKRKINKEDLTFVSGVSTAIIDNEAPQLTRGRSLCQQHAERTTDWTLDVWTERAASFPWTDHVK
jgi:hypothetical protein